jgi:hypothetical protein
MRRSLIVALSAGFAILAFAKPAVSAPSTATPHYGESSESVVYRHWRGRPYYRGYAYGYRPYYRPYAYYGPYSYYGPYAYYGPPYAYYGYPYYGRPGISLQFGF